MNSTILRIHILLGIVFAIPVFAWASSGLLYALPDTVEGGAINQIDSSRPLLSPQDAVSLANRFSGRKLPLTALTLLMRGNHPVYQAIGGMGADSLLIDAESGEVIKTPPPGILTRYFRQAHFYFFAGRFQVLFLVLFSALSAISALTGVYLAARWLFFSPTQRSTTRLFSQS